MRLKTQLLLLFIALLKISTASAQSEGPVFTSDTSVKVYDQSGHEQVMAWSGGFNKPQFSMGDVNNDGLQDLVVFETWSEVRVFINKGSAGNPKYVYDPKYELNFPPVTDYMVLADYNKDGIPDLFTQESAIGFMIYRGYYNSKNELCFNFYKRLYYKNYKSDSVDNVNAYNNPGDIPAIVDVDNDGDLDIVSYDVLGGYMNWYRNVSVEEGLPLDSFKIKLWDQCWGKVFQGWYRTHTLGVTCDNSNLILVPKNANKKNHSGNTPCLFDYDMDGDYDYLDGSISYNQMTFLLNGRIQNGGPDSMVSQDTMWQSNGNIIDLPVWPAAFNVDIDQDGKKDLLISPNTQAENYRCIWFYKNNSTPNNPSWSFQSDTFLIDQTIDLGTAAYPQLFDFNKDGKPDLFIGSDGYYQANGTLISRVSYYLNTSTSGHPSFTLQTKDFLGLGVTYGFKGNAPAFGDLNNDGVADMVIGHTDGTISFIKNNASSDNSQPQFQMAQQTLVDINNVPISVPANAAPFIYDMDKDGKPDLIIGENTGFLRFYRNVSTVAGQVKLQLANPILGHARSDPNYLSGNYSTPFIGKIDSTGKDYILMGSSSGYLYRYDNFQNADTGANVHFTMIDSIYADIDTMFNFYKYSWDTGNVLPKVYYDGFRSAPTVGDIDGDGKYEMIVGEIYGGVKIYKQTPVTRVPNINKGNQTAQINIYPNPANDVINISWNEAFVLPNVQISIYNMQGQLVLSESAASFKKQARIPVSSLASGVYICELQSGGSKAYGRFSLIR